MGYSAQRQNVLLCLAALEAVLRAEGWKSEPGAGAAAAVAHYRSAEGPRELTAAALR